MLYQKKLKKICFDVFFVCFLGGKYREMEFGFVYFFIPMWFFGLSAIDLLWNFHKSMLDRCLCLGLTGNRLVIFEIFLEQLQNLVFLLFFVFLFIITLFHFLFGGFNSVFRGMQAYFALIDDFRHRDVEIFIMRFFLNIFCSKCSFFSYVGHRFFMQDVKQNVLERQKKVS